VPNNTSLWLSLEDSRDDVRKYLQDHLQRVRQQHKNAMAREPEEWPPEEDLQALVRNSDGLFIYAATLVRYMNDRRESPQIKLRKVLTRHDGVDPLYDQVISDAQQCENFHFVLGSVIYLRYPIPLAALAQLLRLEVSDIRLALDRCHSVLVIPESDDDSIRPYHASLRDYLTDEERSKHSFCPPAQFHASIAVACLRAITNGLKTEDAPMEYVSIAWYYHCAALLSQTSDCEHLPVLCHGLKVEIGAVNVRWLKYWMMAAFMWAGAGYIQVELPSAKVSGLSHSGCIYCIIGCKGHVD